MDTQIAPLQFSQDPGCRERHLIRKYCNPLFYQLKNPISQSMIDLAQCADLKEYEDFENEFSQLMVEVDKIPQSLQNNLAGLLSLRDKVDYMYDQCSALGAEKNTDKQKLLAAYQQITNCATSMYKNSEDSSLPIDADPDVRQLHLSLVEYQLVCDLLRPDSPIADSELVATLLTEEVESVQVVMSLFEAEQQEIIRQEARYLVDRLNLNKDKSSNAVLVLQAMLQSKQ